MVLPAGTEETGRAARDQCDPQHSEQGFLTPNYIPQSLEALSPTPPKG